MSQTSEKQLHTAFQHVKKHEKVLHQRIIREVAAALIAFTKQTGVTVSTIDIHLLDTSTVEGPWTFMPSSVTTNLQFKGCTIES